MTHPQQPVVDDHFHPNAIVRYLYLLAKNSSNVGMDEIALLEFSEDDWKQFRQLIGYRISGYRELGHTEPLEGTDL